MEAEFPTFGDLQEKMAGASREFKETQWGEDIETALFRITILRDIDIRDNSALAHKLFSGHLLKADGEWMPVNWQALHRCRKVGGTWKIVGFTGYLPQTPSVSAKERKPELSFKQIPVGAYQHKTAGPYFLVLIVNSEQLIVISGQAAIDDEGVVIGDTI